MDRAIRYWKQVKKEFEGGIPNVRIGFAPVKKWECNELYCDFYDVCGGGLDAD